MAKNPDPTLCIIGAGRVGSVLASHFVKANFSITEIIERNKGKHSGLKNYFPHIAINASPTAEIISQSDAIFISVQDDQLAEAVTQIEGLADDFSGKTFVHTSGAYPSNVLAPLKKRNGEIASAHPIYSFGSPDPVKISLKGVYLDLEGDAAALSELKALFQRIGMNTIEISAEQKLAIHVASVLYSNYFVGLAQIAQAVLGASRISKENYWKPFLPLIQSTLNNLSSSSPEEALTGPIKRADIHTIEKHLDFISQHLPEALPVYLQMSRSIIEFTPIPEAIQLKLNEVLRRFENGNR